MALNYREWREGDDLELIQLWGGPENAQVEQARALFRPSSNAPWLRCIVAEDTVGTGSVGSDAGVPVAAAYVFEPKLHNQRLWAYVEVAADHRRAGVGSTLLAMLRNEAAGSPSGATALRAKVIPGSTGGDFALASGLAPIQRSRIVRVEPGALALPVFEDNGGPQLDEAATGSVELTTAVAAWYNAVHAWDPAHMTLGQAQQYLLADTTGAGGAVVLRDKPQADGGRIAAFAISYTQTRTDDPADVLVGYDPTMAPAEQEAAVASLLAMLVHQFPVLVEVDDSMTALVKVIDPLLAMGTASVSAPETLVVSD
ncbi:GNAT family N-acetyltransferase [Arthrobacter sp. CAN_C5]|uniref:GNAT family N-acetyltransferase n=1 Tax=Arthrobacter sp. CAN_C5 TaxID=2760706 RepID=UPI001AE4C714|nr:GNAT family N-acetyltransferase [Arthrobacter sp. CAN_C5]MBP2217646.1 GNAT superfamily N-acetyltransferase [Arthrobacter sp. CAN_C5]